MISRGPGRVPSPWWRPHPAQSSTVSKSEPPGVPNPSFLLILNSRNPIIVRNLNHRCPRESWAASWAASFGAISQEHPLSCTPSFFKSHRVS